MSHDNPLTEEELARRARASLESHELSDQVQRRLRSARAQAVEQLAQTEERHSATGWLSGQGRWLLPAGALGTAGALGLAWVMSQPVTPVMPLLDEQEIAALNEMELLDEIEFVAWMMEQSNGTDPDEG